MQLMRKMEHLVPIDFDELAQGFGEHDDLTNLSYQIKQKLIFIIIEFQTLN
jgi:hypothetical protein